MRVFHGFRPISTIRRHLPVALPAPAVTVSQSQIFDPDDWKCVPEEFVSPDSESWTFGAHEHEEEGEKVVENDLKCIEKKRKSKKEEVIEENRADGHAPIKSAASILMHSLQKSSSMATSLSDIDVTLFNFHSTKFAERLLNRNISSVVIVESSHVFSKSAKKFAEKLANVDAYRADIYTLMGTEEPSELEGSDEHFQGFGSKKAEKSSKFENIRPLTLGSCDTEMEEVKVRRPHLLAVLPTANIQRTILESMMQHAILHHSGLDADTVFRYGDTNLLTFLSCGTLAQYTCSTDARLHFLAHPHRRHSALFDKLFSLKILNSSAHPQSELTGYPPTSFHPQLPTSKKVPHVKKLAECQLIDGLQYPVQIAPRKRVMIDGKEVISGDGSGRKLIDFGCFMTQIGRQQNSRPVGEIFRAIWPESSLSIPADILSDDKVGTLPTEHLEALFTYVREELAATPIAKSYAADLKIKRVV